MRSVLLAVSTLLLLFVVAVVASDVPSTLHARGYHHDARQIVEIFEPVPLPAGWKRVAEAQVQESERRIDVLVALKRRNLDLLEETFWAVSDPKSEQYGKHLTLEQVADLIAPEQNTIEEVISWLEYHGVKDPVVHQSRDYISASIDVPTASRLFGVKFFTYKHENGLTIDATVGPYSLPSRIASNVDLVSGLVGFPDVAVASKYRRESTQIGKPDITPTVIRARYNITDNVDTPNPKNARAVAEFQAEYFSPRDLQLFYKKFIPDATYTPITNIIGSNTPTDPGLEASLDIQYIIGVVPNITTWFYSMKSYQFWSDLVKWTSEIQNEQNPPYVHSVSYGEQGNYPSVSYRDRLSQDFQAIGVRGISIIFASGDSGAGCTGIGAKAEFGVSKCDCAFYPSFPATSPYVTSVGATAFISDTSASGPEMAVKAFKSGGGFSYIFDTTPEQASVVSAYFSSGVTLPEACAYNASGRATPDVSALGDIAFQVYQGGSVTTVGGTSASAPTFSAIISLLNEQRLNAGKSTLGFLNTWIYQSAQTSGAFFDVTDGNNLTPGCCSSGKLGGFECATGYDPITGVGTPNYEVLKTLI